jgi:hypothetical protein
LLADFVQLSLEPLAFGLLPVVLFGQLVPFGDGCRDLCDGFLSESSRASGLGLDFFDLPDEFGRTSFKRLLSFLDPPEGKKLLLLACQRLNGVQQVRVIWFLMAFHECQKSLEPVGLFNTAVDAGLQSVGLFVTFPVFLISTLGEEEVPGTCDRGVLLCSRGRLALNCLNGSFPGWTFLFGRGNWRA